MRYFSMLFFMFIALFMCHVSAFAQESGNVVNEPASEVDTAENAEALEGESGRQEVSRPRTMKDNFRGWRFDADIYSGAAYGHYNDSSSPESDYEYKDGWSLALFLNVDFGYLWGDRVFIGPVLTVTSGLWDIFGCDLRAKFVVPLTNKDAFSTSLGLGMSLRLLDINDTYIYRSVSADKKVPGSTASDAIALLYIPVQFGYEHVFDSGFILGVAAEMRINFKEKHRVYSYVDESGREVKLGTQDIGVGYMGLISAGVHMGYKF